EGREEERLRISKMLHDGVLPKLYAVRVEFECLNLKGTADRLTAHRKILDELEHIHKEIREASHALRAKSLFAPVNFTAVIGDLAKERAVTGKFKLTMDADPKIDWSVYK